MYAHKTVFVIVIVLDENAWRIESIKVNRDDHKMLEKKENITPCR
jgi:hypothetical protein